MPVWIAVAFSVYATHALWQGVSIARQKEPIYLLYVAPVLLVKFALLGIAISYWSESHCETVSGLWKGFLAIPLTLAIVEGRGMYSIIKHDRYTLERSPFYYPALAFQFVVSVALPFLLLWFGFRVLALQQCGG